MKEKRNALWEQYAPIPGQGVQIAVLSAIIAIIIFVCAFNTVKLNTALSGLTERYVEDVANQLTNDLSSQIEADLAALQLLADSVVQMQSENSSDEKMAEYLERKAAILGFDEMALISRDGSQVSNEDPGLISADAQGIQNAFQGECNVSNVQEECLLYAVPVYKEHKISEVLAGIRSQDNVQKLIQLTGFGKNELTCIIDSQGNVVIAPSDAKPFFRLDDIIKKDSEQEEKNAVIDMKNNMQQGKDGVFQFTTVTGKKLIMSYHSLHQSDWIMLTLVPADLIVSETSGYILKTFLVIAAIGILNLLFLFMLLRLYRTSNRRLEQAAFTDTLTGGMNNAAFQEKYRLLTEGMEPNTYAVVFFNIKGFKLINENFGIVSGNAVIKYVYHRLIEHMKEEEFAARSESDHFFLCIRESQNEAIIKRIGDIEKDINGFNEYTEIPYNLHFFQGVYLVDDPGVEITIIQDRARAACQKIKQKNQTGCEFYNAALTEQMQMEQELDSLFEESITGKYFQVYLQPKVCLHSFTVGGAEALVRWIHPTEGMISPGVFIPVLEKNGKICRLDLYVFETVCEMLHKWEEEGREKITISVNLSRQHFKNLNFLKEFSAIAARYHIKQGMIEFELTESVFVDEQQIDLIKCGIREMHKKGFLCSLDDFGAGFSSLGLLKEFEVDTIKLDKRFFDELSGDKARTLISCLLEMADRLNMKTVAEGIETAEQLEYLQQTKCDMIQGYIFSKPLPLPEFEVWRKGMG